MSAEPVVIYRDGKYENPPVDEEKGNNAFAREYFRAGRKFRILSGGGEAGTLSIIKYQEPGCVGLVAEATAETPARLGGRVKVLGHRLADARPRRPLAPRADRGGARARRGAGARRLREEPRRRLARGEDGGGEPDGDRPRPRRQLRAGRQLPRPESRWRRRRRATRSSSSWSRRAAPCKTAWEWFHQGSEDSYEDRHFVDQVDLDGDGVGEVVVMGSYYESNDYVIYKRQQGRWRPVYKGGGGGC